jgi:hypothetical protein
MTGNETYLRTLLYVVEVCITILRSHLIPTLCMAKNNLSEHVLDIYTDSHMITKTTGIWRKQERSDEGG